VYVKIAVRLEAIRIVIKTYAHLQNIGIDKTELKYQQNGLVLHYTA